MESLETMSRLAVLAFVVSCMLAAGLGLCAREVAAALRSPSLVIRILLANFLFAPAIALGLITIFPLENAHAAGLLLLGGAAGAPFLPKLASLARGDLAFSVGLMLLLTVASLGYMPLVLPRLIPGLTADPWAILKPLLFTMLLPLAIGMVVRSRSPEWSLRLKGIFETISNLSMLLAVGLLIGLNFQAMLAMFGSGAVAVAVLFVALSFAVGFALGGPGRSHRSVLGLGTGQRNVAAALVIATQNFDDPRVAVMLLISTLAGVLVLACAAVRLAPRTSTVSLDQLEPEEARR